MPPSGGRSIATRAIMAVLLMVGFYGLALALAAGLLWIPYAEWRYLHLFTGKLALFCIGGAVLILLAIVPRPDRFPAPGPLLVADRHPRLFAELEGLARAVDEEMPSEVYLVADVNAWVAQRGGFMGFGSRRVMGLGLPLLQNVRISQLRAVLAHEFGHYRSGDTRLGPWIYKTREAIGRTLHALSGHASIQKPFHWYGLLFLRITQAISRRQEVQADALAVRVAGASALADGLRAIHRAALAFAPYWHTEVVPVLGAGYRPPLGEGFARFVEQPAVQEQLAKAEEEELARTQADPYDSHPSLRERLAALAGHPAAPPAEPDPLALSLLTDPHTMEPELLAIIGNAEKASHLQPLGWEEVGPRVVVPHWEAFLKDCGLGLRGLTPRSLPTIDWEQLGLRVAANLRDEEARKEPLRTAEYAVGTALGLLLARRGWTVVALPGQTVRLVQGTESLDLRDVRGHICARPEDWLAFCERAGVAATHLGDLA